MDAVHSQHGDTWKNPMKCGGFNFGQKRFKLKHCARYLFTKAHIIAFLRRELLLAYFKLQYPEPYERIYDELHN